MIFKLIFLCLSLLLRGSASKTFCILCDVFSFGTLHLFLWDIALILLGHCTYSIGTLQLSNKGFAKPLLWTNY